MKITNKSKDNPKLMQAKLGDGQISLYLEYYLGRESTPILDEYGEPVLYESGKMKGTPMYKVKHNRRKESLKLYLIEKPRTPIERQKNSETLELAKRIRFEREQQLLQSTEGYRIKEKREVNLHDYFLNYIDGYTKKDNRMVTLAYRRFVDFLNDTPEYSIYSKQIKPNQLTKDMIMDFTDYLQSRSKGEGAQTIYKRFKKVIKHAVEHEVMQKNPCNGISITIDENVLRKDILSADEIQTLASTHYKGENPDIRRAFIFCLYSGLRFCDVKELTFANVDFSNKVLKFEQNKTKGHSASSWVTIPLSELHLFLIGQPNEGEGKDAIIFPLPSATMCSKALRNWTKHAGIDKHITWHCARHSFATNILSNGANIKTVASLLGHNGLKQTEKYVRAIDSLKMSAIATLPKITNI